MTADRREGRGRLSSIDQLPDEAEGDILWAIEALRKREQPQIAILEEFNSRLADRGIGSVSKSAFSRWSLRKAAQFRRLDEVRTITGDIVAGLGTDGAEEVTIAVAEMLKVAIYERLEGEVDEKGLQALGRSLNAAVAAQRTAADHRRKLEEREERARAEAAKAVEDVVDRATAVAREAGLSEETVWQMRRDVLGMRS